MWWIHISDCKINIKMCTSTSTFHVCTSLIFWWKFSPLNVSNLELKKHQKADVAIGIRPRILKSRVNHIYSFNFFLSNKTYLIQVNTKGQSKLNKANILSSEWFQCINIFLWHINEMITTVYLQNDSSISLESFCT